jgi:hypothetical protein
MARRDKRISEWQNATNPSRKSRRTPNFHEQGHDDFVGLLPSAGTGEMGVE